MPVHTWRAGCSEKVQFANREQAMESMKRLVERYPERLYNVYKCLHCGKFHVGTLKKQY